MISRYMFQGTNGRYPNVDDLSEGLTTEKSDPNTWIKLSLEQFGCKFDTVSSRNEVVLDCQSEISMVISPGWGNQKLQRFPCQI